MSLAAPAPAPRATALGTARVRIIAAPVRLSDGRLQIADDARVLLQSPPRLRPCDIPRADCRMIVYDLP